MDVVSLLVGQFIRFVLVLFRIGGIVMVTPVIGGPQLARRIKVLLAVMISVAVFPVIPARLQMMPANMAHLAVGIAGEVAMGLVCGFAVNIVFAAAQLGGTIIARQMGTALARVFNPMMEAQMPVMGQFYHMLALVVFVSMNGHHILLAGIIRTFERVPLLGVRFHPGMVPRVAGLMGDMFVLVVRLSAPVLVTLFLVTIVLGIIARTVPQMNVLLIGFPLKITLGLLLTAFGLAGAAGLLADSFRWIFREVDVLIRFMTP